MKKILSIVFAVLATAFTFTSCEDIPMPYDYPGTGGSTDTPTVIEPTGSGTELDPFNVAAAIEKCKEVGTTATTDFFFVKGVIKTIDASGVAQYGNVNIDMIDEGGKDVFKAFQILHIDKARFTEATASALQPGDVIVVRGQLVNYSGNTPETVGKGSAYIVTVNGLGNCDPNQPAAEAKGDGTLENPYNPAGANAFASSLAADKNSDVIYIKGKISNITEKPASKFGNATFYISEDGTANDEFYVFRCYNLGNVKFTDADAESIKAGDEVIICGPVVNYKGNTPETVQNKAYIYSLNGKVEADPNGGNDNPNPPSEPEVKPDVPDVPATGDNLLGNGDFETWADGVPVNWKSACTASSATLAQSTDAHGGSFSVNVNGNESSNKRLAYKELELEAGTYVFSFYAKPTDALSQVRPGYVPVTDGSVGTYAYGDYVTLASDWNLCTYEFTLTAKTTICLVVMNPKKSGYSAGKDVLIDDAQLIKK